MGRARQLSPFRGGIECKINPKRPLHPFTTTPSPLPLLGECTIEYRAQKKKFTLKFQYINPSFKHLGPFYSI